MTGRFATSIYELHRESTHSLETHDQAAIEEAASQLAEQVDLIRFIKTNKNFYNKLVLLWLKFKLVNAERLDVPDSRDEFTNFACAQLTISS